MMDNKKIKYELQIETISPVSIGNGDTLSPLSDYLIDEEEIFYIDRQKLESYLEDDSRLLEIFTSGVYNVSNKNKFNFLKNFIKHELQEEPETISKYSVPVYKNRSQNPVELHTIEKSVNRPYIPGSTLKGAFKWAMLYQYIKKNNKIDSLIRTINNPAHTRKSERDKEREIERDFQKIENELFGNIRNGTVKRMPFSMFKISDSQPAKKNAHVYEFVREHLRKGTKVISQFREALNNEILDFKISISDAFKHKNLLFLNNEEPFGLFKIINATVSDIIKFEMKTIENSNIGIETDSYIKGDLLDFYEDILERINNNNNEIAFLPIGFAKNYFLNSIGLLIKQKDEEAFINMRKILRMGKRGQLFFPVTRYVCFSEPFIPAGWVKISKHGYKEQKTSEPQQVPKNKNLNTIENKLEHNPVKQDNYSKEQIKTDAVITAKVLKIEKPQSTVEILIDNEPVQVKMTGTKKAQKHIQFVENSIVKVCLTVKGEEITQTQFVSL